MTKTQISHLCVGQRFKIQVPLGYVVRYSDNTRTSDKTHIFCNLIVDEPKILATGTIVEVVGVGLAGKGGVKGWLGFEVLVKSIPSWVGRIDWGRPVIKRGMRFQMANDSAMADWCKPVDKVRLQKPRDRFRDLLI